jgi:FixJ family two-component response regulator
MCRGRPKAALVLTPAEKGHLDSLAKATSSEDSVSKRAKIVLLCAEGLENREVARRLGASPHTVAVGARTSCVGRARVDGHAFPHLSDPNGPAVFWPRISAPF